MFLRLTVARVGPSLARNVPGEMAWLRDESVTLGPMVKARPSLRPPSAADLVAAHERIRPYVHQTPIMTSTFVDESCGAQVFFKCENLQKSGVFKVRGAWNAARTQDRRARRRLP